MAAKSYPFLTRCAAALVFVLACVGGGEAVAEHPRFLRIDTGGVAGTYLPIDRLIAEGLTPPPAPGRCPDSGPCGIPGYVTVAQIANGSVANVNDVLSGDLDAGLAQADIVHAAYQPVDEVGFG